MLDTGGAKVGHLLQIPLTLRLFLPPPHRLHAAGQLSQSAHFSLQLPYTVLGLGRSANFLDHLYVGVPRRTGETVRTADPKLALASLCVCVSLQGPGTRNRDSGERGWVSKAPKTVCK